MVDQQTKDRTKTTPMLLCLKICMHIFNLLYLIIGAAVLAIGIWSKVKLYVYMELTGLNVDNTAYVMIGVGSLILLVSIAGFYCTAKDKVALLYIYGIFISFIVILEIAAGIAAAVFWPKIDSIFHDALNKSIRAAYSNEQAGKAWDDVQIMLHCCGVVGPEDWQGKIPGSCFGLNQQNRSKRDVNGSDISPQSSVQPATESEATTLLSSPSTASVPAATTAKISIAATTTTAVSVASTTTAPTPAPTATMQSVPAGNVPFQEGCYTKVSANVKKYLSAILGVAFGFLVVQVIGTVFACCLARRTTHNNYEQIY